MHVQAGVDADGKPGAGVLRQRPRQVSQAAQLVGGHYQRAQASRCRLQLPPAKVQLADSLQSPGCSMGSRGAGRRRGGEPINGNRVSGAPQIHRLRSGKPVASPRSKPLVSGSHTARQSAPVYSQRSVALPQTATCGGLHVCDTSWPRKSTSTVARVVAAGWCGATSPLSSAACSSCAPAGW